MSHTKKSKNTIFRIIPGLIILSLSFGTVYGENIPTSDRYWNDVARYLGGLSPLPGSSTEKFETKPEAAIHRKFFIKSWENVETKNLSPQTEWAKTQIQQERSSDRTVFYPFSGPDFLNIFTFLPNGKEYILFGMEPPGLPPDPEMISPAQLPTALANLRNSLATILNFSFFRTIDMNKDLSKTDLGGTTPVILVFMSRTGNAVKNVENVALEKEGTIRLIKDPHAIVNGKPTAKTLRVLPDEIPGVKITFRRPDASADQYLYYFSLDISDTGLKSKGQLLTFVKNKGQKSTYLKAASYLMYRDTFSMIRNFILDECVFIMQDDSGMPLNSFKTDLWNLKFYGNYIKPIQLFESRFQPDLRAVYTEKKNQIGELPFGIGYNWKQGESNLMTARKIK